MINKRTLDVKVDQFQEFSITQRKMVSLLDNVWNSKEMMKPKIVNLFSHHVKNTRFKTTVLLQKKNQSNKKSIEMDQLLQLSLSIKIS